MERRQGFFAALREEVARGLSPARSRRRSDAVELAAVLRFTGGVSGGGGGGGGEMLAPLMEGPDPESGDGEYGGGGGGGSRARKEGWGQWVRGQFARAPSSVAAAAAGAGAARNDLRLLLGVMGAPLAPAHVCATEPLPHLSVKDTPITLSAQYILQQYLAASGGHKLLVSVRNAYTMGKVRMVATEFETAGRVVKNRNAGRGAEPGRFVLWQMAPEMWYIELAVGGSKVHAGCNGKLVWRHTPWLGAHAAKGPVRPLRRALQGLDPLATASMFAGARCIGERKVNGEDCFILKLCTEPETLKARSEGLAEIIRHVMFGYFSQRTGLLVHIEDSHLTRIQSTTGGDVVYWETTINSFIEDYRPVEGIMIAHSGRSAVTLFRFGEVAMSHTKTRMEEAWSIEEVAFDVPGLSMDCFIPPTDVKSGSVGETMELSHGEKSKVGPPPGHRAKVAALEKAEDNKMAWSGTILDDHK
ncbi:uncharacterized protein LOC133915859 isoform X1 [Phragmites australis]|uniref:uncharacterized protein LOC133915859 isoform X1 n=1 Tax=Phragmites australis TaxID=29695 RepID=UPI002D7935B0|nr:uncharacterized protein LOC133915859 isoform X1 [Phragmites australis]